MHFNVNKVIKISFSVETDVASAKPDADLLKTNGTITVVAMPGSTSTALQDLASAPFDTYLIEWPTYSDVTGLAEKIFNSLNPTST